MKENDFKKSKCLIYLDTSNLYDWAIIQKLMFEEYFDENWIISELNNKNLNKMG